MLVELTADAADFPRAMKSRNTVTPSRAESDQPMRQAIAQEYRAMRRARASSWETTRPASTSAKPRTRRQRQVLDLGRIETDLASEPLAGREVDQNGNAERRRRAVA
jgi:hypothetical protein